jgi:hypothetical protein
MMEKRKRRNTISRGRTKRKEKDKKAGKRKG